MQLFVIACLFLHYAAAMTLFGAATFRLSIADDDSAGIDARLRPVLRAAWIVFMVSAIAVLLASAATMAGAWSEAVSPQTVGAVLLDTAFGKVWQWHLGLGFLAGLMVWVTPSRQPWVAAMAMLLLASLALVGHAAMVEGLPGDLRRVNQAVHLLAAGAWVGGLLTLGIALPFLRVRPGAAIALLHRFSRYGTIAVAVVLATGVINAVLLVGNVDALITTQYGWALLVKLALVVVMIGFASRNRFRFTPQLATDPDRTNRRLRRSILLEFAVGLGVILAASALGTLAPPNG